jgi:hypothetical protein
MTILFTPTASGVTLDETGGFQFSGSGDNTAGATDADDSDVLLALLLADRPLVYANLFTDLALPTGFADGRGIAHGTIGTATSDTPITSITPDFDDGDSSGFFTTTGKELFLYHTAFNPNIVLLREADGGGAADPNGAIAVALFIDVDVDGTDLSEQVDVWIVQTEALQAPDPTAPDETITLANLSLNVRAVLEFDFEGAPAGQNYFMQFGDANGALLVSGKNPVDDTTSGFITGHTVNSSHGGGLTTLGSNNWKPVVRNTGSLFE